MRLMFPERHPKILVAVAFDDRLERLLEAAEALAQRTHASLRLVHVCDPWTKSYLAPAVEAGPSDLVQALKDEVARVAYRRLDAIRRTLSPKLKIETEVLAGDLIKSLAADAEANEVGLILVGANKGGKAGTSLGFSTAVGLITDATVPVMVLNETARLDPAVERWRIVVADDFTDVSKAALDLGLSMAHAVPGSSLTHLHVEYYGGANRGHKVRATTDGALTRERLEHTLRQAEERMIDRCSGRTEGIEDAGGTYRMEVVTGTVPDEIERTTAAERAHIAIFGQHRIFHRQTMHVGQVPFKAMLAAARPVIVVPQHV